MPDLSSLVRVVTFLMPAAFTRSSRSDFLYPLSPLRMRSSTFAIAAFIPPIPVDIDSVSIAETSLTFFAVTAFAMRSAFLLAVSTSFSSLFSSE